MKKLLVLICVLTITVSASASLFVRATDSLGAQLIYDDDLDVTWYDFSTGSMTWAGAKTWAADLTVVVNGTQLSDWKLPAVNNEFEHLYQTELGLTVGTAPTLSEINAQEFDSLLQSLYWTSTDGTNNYAYAFSFITTGWDQYSVHTPGTSHNWFEYNPNDAVIAMAVIDGDVVPEPATICLLGLGGLLLRRRKSA